ncbi:MAG TPA: DUF5302 domain-containing protein [Jatrophihabitans sp.]|jgi:hypothetical protein|nr:DUF5302 domain-containing protein [Jatrophihabitans sp.]
MSADEAPANEATDETDEATDLKEQFRQALARKKGQHADGVSGSGPDANKIHDVHGRAGAKRQFRRKSGG